MVKQAVLADRRCARRILDACQNWSSGLPRTAVRARGKRPRLTGDYNAGYEPVGILERCLRWSPPSDLVGCLTSGHEFGLRRALERSDADLCF